MIKRYSRTIICLCLMIMFLNLVPQLVMAQEDEEAIGTEFTDPDAPIDGGIGILIAAGVGYGIKKYRDERKRSSARP